MATNSVELPPIEWDVTYGTEMDECAVSVIETVDGGFALAGFVELYDPISHFDRGWLVKVDSMGNEEWNVTYEGACIGTWFSVVEIAEGEYVLAGGTASSEASDADACLVKVDSMGNIKDEWVYGDAENNLVYSVVSTTDGGYACGGSTWSSETDSDDYWLVKVDSMGNEEWNVTYGGEGADWGHFVIQTVDKGYALFGHVLYGDSMLVKVDQYGNVEWNRTFEARGMRVIETTDGGYALVGESNAHHDAWLVKTDSNGNEEWNVTLVGGSANSVVQTSDGGFALVGHAEGLNSESNAFWARVDSSGNLDLDSFILFGGDDDDAAVDVVQMVDGGYAVAGYTKSFGAGGQDFWLVKLSPPRKSAVIVDPFYSEWGFYKNLVYDVQDSLEVAGYSVSSVQDTGVTVEWLRDGLKHGVVLWRGHTVQGTPSGIGLVTGEVVTYENALEYKDDIESHRIVNITKGSNKYWVITPAFIEYYYTSNRFQYSLVVVEGCSSLSDSSLASTFVDVGVATYVGYIIEVVEPLTSYDMKTLFKNLCEKGYTVGEAVDSVFWGKGLLEYFGDPELRLTYLKDATASIAFVIQSPANLYVTDPEGHHIGFDPITNQSVIEIPEAMYTSPEIEPQVIWIPYALNGTYNILLSGTESGLYNLTVGISSLSQTKTESWVGVITPNQTVQLEAFVLGTELEVIPEFPSFIILPLFMIATLLAVIVYRRKHTL